MIQPGVAAIVLLAGACVGSFLNVVVWRLPRQESLLHPGSHCPRCGSDLPWREKLPVVSWLAQRGRCCHCQGPISWRYPLVELLVAALWLGCLWASPDALGSSPTRLLVVLAGWWLVSLSVVLALIDLDHLWLPEGLCRLGVGTGLALTVLVAVVQGVPSGRALVLNHLIAAGSGLLLMEALAALGSRFLGRPALGLGDAKLAAMIGAWLGLSGFLVSLALAIAAGAVIGVAGRISGRLGPSQPMPFGPFLVLGCLVVWFGGAAPWLARLGL